MLARFSYRHRQTEFRPKRGESNGEVLRLDFRPQIDASVSWIRRHVRCQFARVSRIRQGRARPRKLARSSNPLRMTGSGYPHTSRRPATLPETRRSRSPAKAQRGCGSHLFRDGDGAAPASACNEVLRQEAKAIGVDLRRFPDCAKTFPVLLFKIPCSSKSNSLFRCAGNLAVTLRICFEIRTHFLL